VDVGKVASREKLGDEVARAVRERLMIPDNHFSQLFNGERAQFHDAILRATLLWLGLQNVPGHTFGPVLVERCKAAVQFVSLCTGQLNLLVVIARAVHVVSSRPLRIMAIRRGSRLPCRTAITQSGRSSGAYAIR
jgi:hypothetical protein